MASRISRKVCTLGRSGALGTGRWGSIQDHSASDKSVWYALLMLGTLPSHLLKAPFRTVSLAGLWPFTLRSRARRLTVLLTALRLLVCRPLAATRRKSAPEPTTPFSPTPTRQRRLDSSCG